LVDVKATRDGFFAVSGVDLASGERYRVSYRSESVDELVFSFYKGELYKMVVTYERASTEGLTADDMVKSISAKYGPATSIALKIDAAANEQYAVRGKPVASWEDSQYSLNLVAIFVLQCLSADRLLQTSHGRSRCSACGSREGG